VGCALNAFSRQMLIIYLRYPFFICNFILLGRPNCIVDIDRGQTLVTVKFRHWMWAVICFLRGEFVREIKNKSHPPDKEVFDLLVLIGCN
jgi:hypothetical protein